MPAHETVTRRGWPRALILSLALTVAMQLTGCGDQERRVSPGTALVEQNDWEFNPGVLPPGQRFYLLLMAVRNESSDDLVLESIRPLATNNVPDVARLVDVNLAPRGPHLPPVSMGPYSLYPIRARYRGRCVSQPVVEVEGQTIEPATGPSDGMFLLTTWEMISPGDAYVDGFEVTYRQNDALFREEIPLEVRLEVRKDAAKPPLTTGERACRDMDLAAGPLAIATAKGVLREST